jgi:hypothetical protein
MSAGNILFLRIEAVSSLCAVVASAGGTLVEENIDAATFEQLATMPLISVCLDALDRTWREWSTSTSFVIRRLLNKKHLTTEGTTTSSFQSIPGDALRNNNESQKTTTTAAAAAAEAMGKSNVVMKTVSDSSSSYQQGVAPTTYFMEDVSLHSKPNDCWLVIKDKVHGDHDPLSNHLQFSTAYSSSSAHPHGGDGFLQMHPNGVAAYVSSWGGLQMHPHGIVLA